MKNLGWVREPAVWIVLGAAAVAAGMVSVPTVLDLLVANADTLLPAAYAENLLHHSATLATFQLPRVPSILPDLALYGGLFAVVPNWRWAAFAYAILSYVGLVLAGGAVVGQMAGVGWRRGAAGLLAVSAAGLLLQVGTGAAVGALFYVFVPVVHSGSFILSLAALLMVRRGLTRPSAGWAAATAVVTALGMLSDKLFFGSFLVPMGAGAIAWAVLRGGSAVPVLLRVLPAAFGCGIGDGLGTVLFTRWLLREPDMPIEPHVQLALLGAMAQDHYVWLAVGAAGTVVALPWLWARREPGLAFWWAAGSVTVIGFLGLLPLLYADVYATRYVQPVWWWGVMVLTAGLLRLAPRWAIPAAGALAALGAAILVPGGHDLAHPGAVLAAGSPVAACLAPLEAQGLIHAGIAHYWDARRIEAMSGWQLQVEPVINGGRIFVWGNNLSDYLHDRSDPAKPPLFDFIIMDRLVAADVRGRFGTPDRVIPCPGTDVWVYAAPGGFGRLIGLIGVAGEREGILDRSACFTARDFKTHAGPLPPGGTTVPDAAVPHDYAAWGPYVPLRAGAWSLRLTYRLDGDGTADRDWDIAIDGGNTVLKAGRLDRGGAGRMVQTVDFAVPHDTSPLEIHLMLQPGDRFQVESVGIKRQGMPAETCEP